MSEDLIDRLGEVRISDFSDKWNSFALACADEERNKENKKKRDVLLRLERRYASNIENSFNPIKAAYFGFKLICLITSREYKQSVYS